MLIGENAIFFRELCPLANRRRARSSNEFISEWSFIMLATIEAWQKFLLFPILKSRQFQRHESRHFFKVKEWKSRYFSIWVQVWTSKIFFSLLFFNLFWMICFWNYVLKSPIILWNTYLNFTFRPHLMCSCFNVK